MYDFKQESHVPAVVGINAAEGGMHVACESNKLIITYKLYILNLNY